MPVTPGAWDDAWSSVQQTAEGFGVDRSTLVARLEAASSEGDPSQLRLEELVLVLGCAAGNAKAIRTFENDYLVPTRGSLRRLHDDPAFVDEVQQRVRERLLVAKETSPPRIATYAGRGALGGWVTVTAVRIAMTVLREHAKTQHIPEQGWAASLTLADTGDQELEYLKSRYREAFGKALLSAAKRLPDRDRSVLKLSFAEDLSIDRIGSIYGVHRSTVARWIIKAKDDLLALTREALQQEEGIPAEELSSLQRLVRSQLETSLTGLFS